MSLLKYYCLNIFDSNYIRKARVCKYKSVLRNIRLAFFHRVSSRMSVR